MQIKRIMEYREEYFPTPRSRKMRTRHVEAEFTAEIKEAAMNDAPIVLKVHAYESYANGLYATDYRRYNGKLYTQALYGRYFNCEEAAYMLPVTTANDVNRLFILGDRYRSKEEVAANYQAQADNLLILDGTVWVSASEPFYYVQTFGLGRNHGGTALMIDRIGHRGDHSRAFSALQHEEAIASAVQVAMDRGDTDYVSSIQDRRYYIEVIDPTAVQFQRQMYVFQVEQCVYRTINVKACNYAQALDIARKLSSSWYDESHVSYCDNGVVEDAKKVYSEADLAKYKVEYTWFPGGKDGPGKETATEVFTAGSAQKAVDQAREKHANLEGMRVNHVWKENGDSWMAVNAWSNVKTWNNVNEWN